MKVFLPAALLLLFCFSASAQLFQETNYNHTFRDSRADQERIDHHRTVAVLPPEVLSVARPGPPTPEGSVTFPSPKDLAFQQKIHKNLSSAPGRIRYQSVVTTNGILRKNRVDLTSLSAYDPAELGRLLGVDAVLIVRRDGLAMNPKGEAIAATFAPYSRPQAATLEVIRTRTELYDSETGEKVWGFDSRQRRYLLSPNRPERLWLKHLRSSNPYFDSTKH